MVVSNQLSAVVADSSQTWRWIEDGQGGFRKARLLSEEGGSPIVETPDGKVRPIGLEETWPVNPPKFDGVKDIADLTFLNEPAVLHNLTLRYHNQEFYTKCGLFLIAINPYRHIENLFSPNTVASYRNEQRKVSVPHVFQVAQAAWRNFVDTHRPQSILVTGESGAGKTVNTKMVIRYLTAVTSHVGVHLPTLAQKQDKTHSMLEDQIMVAGPVLEAFGNAKTFRNDNSSRFGKYVRITLTADGIVNGAYMQTYLLEKSRIATRNSNERSFHVFYQLLRGADHHLRKQLQLGDRGVSDFSMTSTSAITIDNVDDAADFKALCRALKTVGFDDLDQENLFRTAAACLHLGDLRCAEGSTAFISTHEVLLRACQVLGVKEADLRRGLCSPRVAAGYQKECVIQARTPQQVLEEAGALAKALYERSFRALVERINASLGGRANAAESLSIGVLDIAGFEIFQHNSFEQLLINLTNERLQQLFNAHFFQQEQELYLREGLQWTTVDYGLNLQPTIDLIEGIEPLGVLSILDDESIMPRGNDADFTRKVAEIWGNIGRPDAGEPILISGGIKTDQFAINHYAGLVKYHTRGWLLKNKDPLNADLVSILATSTHGYIASLFMNVDVASIPYGKRGRKGIFRTVGQGHKEDLDSLINDLDRTEPHYVRCILPNGEKKPRRLDVPLMLHQLRCNGVLEGLRIARQGFPNRLNFQDFRRRYSLLFNDDTQSRCQAERDPQACHSMCQQMGLTSSQYDVGRTLVFFKAGVLAQLEDRRDRLLAETFTRFFSICRRRLIQKMFAKRRNRHIFHKIIRRNTRNFIALQAWPWWRLFKEALPLLETSATSDVSFQKRVDEALAHQRASLQENHTRQIETMTADRRAVESRLENRVEMEQAVAAEKAEQVQRIAEQLAAAHLEIERLNMREQEFKALERTSRMDSDRFSETKAKLQKELKRALASSEDAQLCAAAADEERQRAQQELAELSQRNTDLRREVAASNRTIVEQEQILQQRNDEINHGKQRLMKIIQDSDESVMDAVAACGVAKDEAVALKSEVASGREVIKDLRLKLEKMQHATCAKDAEILSLQRQHDNERVRCASLLQEAQSVQLRVAELTKGIASAQQSQQATSEDATALREELARLQQMLDAKSIEGSKHNSLAVSLQQANAQLSAQLSALHNEKLISVEKHAAEYAELHDEVIRLTKDSQELRKDRTAREVKEAELLQRVETSEQQLVDAVDKRQATTAELSEARQHVLLMTQQMDTFRKEHLVIKKALDVANNRVQDLEDALVLIDQERATGALQTTQLAEALQEAYDDHTSSESLLNNAKLEILRLLSNMRNMEHDAKQLRRQCDQQQLELTQLGSSSRHHVIEHVRVLEQAKKLTDQQLADSFAALQASQAREKQLEKAKQRLTAEIEDINRSRALDHSSS